MPNPMLEAMPSAKASNILIVDDTPANLTILTHLLTKRGHIARSALNGPTALNAVQELLPDLILLDIMMPGMDGYEVCQQLKLNKSTRDIPIIFISASSKVLDKMKAFGVGGVDYVTKPFHGEEVMARVETHLALRAMQRQLQTEINERKRVEESLRASEIELRGLLAERKLAEESLQKVLTEVEERVDELSTLNLIVQMVSATTNLQTALDIIARTMTRLFNAHSTLIFMLNPTRKKQTVIVQHILNGLHHELPSSIDKVWPIFGDPSAEQDIDQHEPLIISQVQTNPLTKPIHEFLQIYQIQSLIGVPLLARGQVIGMIIVSTDQVGREFTFDELDLAETIAKQIVGIVDNARLFEQEQQQRRITESLREVATILNLSLDQKVILTQILAQLRHVIGYDRAGVFLEDGETLVLSGGIGLDETIGNRLSITQPNPTIVRCFNSKQPLFTDDVSVDLNWKLWSGERLIRGWMAVPFLIGQKAIGVLSVESFKVGAYNEEDVQILQTFANQAAIAIQNAQLFEAAQQANRRIQDELTIACHIQQNLLLPPSPHWPDLEVVCYSQPVREVGGDFYTYYAFESQQQGRRAKKKRFAIAVGDVSGKGMPAALLMTISLASLSNLITQTYSSDKLIFDLVAKPLPLGKFLTDLDKAIAVYTATTRQNCALVYLEITRLDEEAATVRAANAGCVMPIIRRNNGTVEWVEAFGIPLGAGLGADLGYNEVELILNKGDLIILTSDGVVEAMNSAKKMFGFQHLEQTIATAPPGNATTMLDHLKQTIATFIGEPHDDLTIVVIQI